jgi:hypothetical protein
VWTTVALTALAGPLGSFALGFGLARWADATTGGMAGLAGGVAGLLFGAPLLAFSAFAICLVTVMRGAALRRWIALLVMLAAVMAELFAIVIGFRVTAGMASPEVGLVGVLIVAVAILGGGAYAGLALARR